MNTFDLRISQRNCRLLQGHKSKLWVDVQNIGNMPNKDWGHIYDYGFNGNVAVATLVGIDKATGKYVYSFRSGSEFTRRLPLTIPTDADGQTNGISQWSVQVGFNTSSDPRGNASSRRPGQPAVFLRERGAHLGPKWAVCWTTRPRRRSQRPA